MPYAFAHPAAVIPLARLLGKSAVPSALVIGSVIPDAWYFVPFLTRSDSHNVAGLFLFCLPAALFAYAAFHLIFKQPLLALLPQALAGRLRACTCPHLPAAPWHAVLVSIAAAVLTHFAWDALTHPGDLVDALPLLASTLAVGRYELRVHQLLQHGSTFAGTAFLVWWICQELRAAPAPAMARVMPAPARAAIIVALLALSAIAFCSVLLAASPSLFFNGGARGLLRAAGVTALSTLGLTALAYCLLWRSRAA